MSEEYRLRAKRVQILDGARRVFLRDGFAGASSDAVAAEAGVSKSTIYAYYLSKEELFVEVLRTLTLENPQIRALESMEGMTPENRKELRRDLLEVAQKINHDHDAARVPGAAPDDHRRHAQVFAAGRALPRHGARADHERLRRLI